MRGILIAAAAALLFAGATIAQDEPSPSMSPDETQQMLKDHSHEPDLSSEPGAGSSDTHTAHSESSSSSSSVSFGVGTPANDNDAAASRAAVARLLFGHRGGATAQASEGGTSCSAPAVGKCAACSVACPAGKSAQCRAGDMGIMTMACPTASKCTCKG